MSDKRSIEAAFARANVPLRVTTRSLNRNVVRGGGQMVQMDISSGRNGETIRMNIPDGDDVAVRVLGEDPEHQQVVLMVKEPERRFVEQFFNTATMKTEERTRKTPGATRRFLVGMDEQHLFIAQLNTTATSVKQAHEGLRPKGVPAGKKAKRKKVRRTGEWFLIPATPEEIAQIEDHIKVFGVRKKVGIGSHLGRMRGRPHVVCESVAIGHTTRTVRVSRWLTRNETADPGTEFVRGRVVHPDHKVVKLKSWHRVVMNTEDRTIGAQWVD